MFVIVSVSSLDAYGPFNNEELAKEWLIKNGYVQEVDGWSKEDKKPVVIRHMFPV